MLSIEDFKLNGKERSVCVDDSCDNNLYKKYINIDCMWFWTFATGDDLTTNRGVTFGDNINKVFQLYGENVLFKYDKNSDILRKYSLMMKDSNEGDFAKLKGDENYCEYTYHEDNVKYKLSCIRFYFDNNKKVVLIGFYNTVDYDLIRTLTGDKDYSLSNKIDYIKSNYEILFDTKNSDKNKEIIDLLSKYINELCNDNRETILAIMAKLYENENVLFNVDIDKAIECREKICKLYSNPRNLNLLGMDYMDIDDWDNAIRVFEQSMRINKSIMAECQLHPCYYKGKEENELDDTSIKKIISNGEDLFNNSLEYITHNRLSEENYELYDYAIPFVIGGVGGLFYRKMHDLNRAYLFYSYALDLYKLFRHDGKEAIENINNIKCNIEKIQKEIANVKNNEIEIKDLQKALKYSLNNESEIFNTENGHEVIFRVFNEKVLIDNEEYTYLIICAGNSDDGSYPLAIESNNYVRLHEHVLPLRVEGNSTMFPDDCSIEYKSIDGNSFIALPDDIENLDIKDNLYYEVTPKIIAYSTKLVNSIKEELLKVQSNEITIDEFYETFFNKIDKDKLLSCTNSLNLLGYTDVAEKFENIDYHIYKYKLIEPYDLDYIFKLIDIYYEITKEYSKK